MADSLEGDPSEDADRVMDRCSFQKDQFDILVHDYRESEAEVGGSFRMTSDALLKKELVNAKHKLMKVKYFFQTLPSPETYATLLERIDVTVKSIEKLGRKADSSEEYTVYNATLPDYDRTDMELLLNDLVETELPPASLWTKTERERNTKILALLGESDILVNECRTIINELKAATKGDKS